MLSEFFEHEEETKYREAINKIWNKWWKEELTEDDKRQYYESKARVLFYMTFQGGLSFSENDKRFRKLIKAREILSYTIY